MNTSLARFLLAMSLAVQTLPATLRAQVFPADDYDEQKESARPDTSAWRGLPARLHAAWASRDELFRRCELPLTAAGSDTALTAWRGERISAAAVLYAPVAQGRLRVEAQGGPGDGTATARFLRYVLTDDYKACGNHPAGLEPWLVPDVLDRPGTVLSLEAMTVRPVWLTVEVPREAQPGDYDVILRVLDEGGSELGRLTLTLHVKARLLPPPAGQRQHIDFWQQPYGVARYYGVPRWSDEHLALLRPYMKMLARAGQSVVTAFLFHEPWGDQSYDKHSAMVQSVKRKDGTWTYDYSVFDRWVEFMASCGIGRQINCYSMVPWDMTFRYFDEALGRDVDLRTTTDSPEYRDLWLPFIRAFAAHLKERGWYDKTCIAMDERALPAMLDAYHVVQEAAPGMKMSLAGNYHPELADKLYDYCIAYDQGWPEDVLADRRRKGWKSTWYTCCSTPEPSLFTNALPAEAAYLPLHGAAMGYDGYLHWSWLNWNADPLRDSRWRLFAPGDTYVVYPGGRSSVRWERFVEGVQQAEKLSLLREDYERDGNRTALDELEAALAPFASRSIPEGRTAGELVSALETLLNR